MLSSLGVIVVVIISIAAVVQGQDKITNKYRPDKNRIIKRLHGSPHAKLFLHGCNADYYAALTVNSTTESSQFKLQQSKEYLFAIFTLEEVSVILSNGEESSNPVSLNITLGKNKNSMAILEVFDKGELIGNITQMMVPILPTIPYYVNVSITNENISVYEARTGASDPFLHFNFTMNINLTSENFNVKFRHSSPIYAHYDCCEQCTPWVYTRVSGCSKYSARTASAETETTYPLMGNQSPNRTDYYLFNQNIVVNHDGNPTFGAKIIFSEFENLRRSRYEIGLSNTPTILHYVNSSAQYIKTLPGLDLKREYAWPFIVNITITRDGVVSLRQPYADFPFLHYDARSKLKPIDVKYMTMVKFHEDFIRYDFYYNCTDVLSFNDRRGPTDKTENVEQQDDDVMNGTSLIDDIDSYPKVWEYISKRSNEIKFDVLHIFHDSYQVYDKGIGAAFEDSGEYDDQSTSSSSPVQSSDKSSEKSKPNGFAELFKKAVVGVGSFLCIGVAKLICSLDFVKNLLKEADVDDDKVKDMSKSVGKVVVNENVLSKFGFELGDD